MVLADPRLLVAQRIEVVDQFEVAAKTQGRIFVEGVEGGEEDAVEHSSCHVRAPCSELSP
jgi:hypothetical protein